MPIAKIIRVLPLTVIVDSGVTNNAMGKPGAKSQRGVAEIYDELKTEQTIVLLTPTGKKGLDALARSFGLSRSEFVEQLARGAIEVMD